MAAIRGQPRLIGVTLSSVRSRSRDWGMCRVPGGDSLDQVASSLPSSLAILPSHSPSPSARDRPWHLQQQRC